jgi:hypothetical protein
VVFYTEDWLKLYQAEQSREGRDAKNGNESLFSLQSIAKIR